MLEAASLPFPKSVNGAQRWISFGGPFQLQPSEPAKLALILWGADLLARKEKLRQLTEWRQLLIPLLPAAIPATWVPCPLSPWSSALPSPRSVLRGAGGACPGNSALSGTLR